MSGQTTDNSFKKTEQTIGANGNDVTATDNTLNDAIMGNRAPGNAENLTQPPNSANSKIERDLDTKGYTTRSSDEELDEAAELNAKLSARGNQAQ